MSSKGRSSRRRFLSGLGAALTLGPFLPILNASGQEASFPKRLIVLWTPHGTVYDRWRPSGTLKDFTLGPILAPLEKHRSQLVVLDGLQITHSKVTAPPHTEGMSVVWTGSNLGAGTAFKVQDYMIDWVEGASVDQTIAQAIGRDTTYPSLEFGVHSAGNYPGSRMIYAGKGQPLQPETNPWRAFDRIFGAFDPSAAGQAAAEKRRAEQRSVLDLVDVQLSALDSKVAASDKLKIDAHLQAVRDLERTLDATRAANCSKPDLGANLGDGKVTDMGAVWQREMDTIAAAMACDLTRVASIQFKFGDNDDDVYSWLGLKSGHHTLSHEGDSNVQAQADLTAIYSWYSQQVGYLLDKLASIPEGDGTLLDNTLVVWGSELGKGNSHSFEKVPFILAGGAGGAFETGRYMTFDGLEHNRLLVSLCHAMGLDTQNTFGTTDIGSGGLPGLI